MGPYMRPIPVGASAAMVFSLVVAFVVTPWAAVRLLRRRHGHHDEPEDRLTALYRRVMRPLIGDAAAARRRSSALVAVLLLAAAALVPLGLVTVKMLPFDNKSELQVDRPHAGGHAARDDGRRRRRRSPTKRCATTPSRACRATRARRRRTPSTASCATTSCGASRTSPICR